MAYNHHDFLPQPYCAQVPGIYAIVNRNNNKVYIGSAAQLNRRWTGHRHDFHIRRQNPHLLRAFEKEREAFYFEVIEELPGVDKQKRLEREQFWINFYKSYVRANGYNMSPKAESCEGIKRTPEFVAKVSKALKGKKWSDERKAHFRATRKKPTKFRSFTPEQRVQQSLARKGGKWSLHQRQAFEGTIKNRPALLLPNHGRPVDQYSASGHYVKTFRAIAYASTETGIPECNIRAALKHPTHSPGGFYWRDSNSDKPLTISIRKRHSSKPRPVVRVNSNGAIVARFPHANEARRKTGIQVPLCLQKGRPDRCGFTWRHE
jgi:group I intron endonuclease